MNKLDELLVALVNKEFPISKRIINYIYLLDWFELFDVFPNNLLPVKFELFALFVFVFAFALLPNKLLAEELPKFPNKLFPRK